MKNIILALVLCLVSLSVLAQDFDLRGLWKRSNAQPEERPLTFIQVNGVYHTHSQERFVYPNGALSHTIDQSVKVTVTPNGEVKGTVDFYDSRGCSYRNLAVTGEFQTADQIGFVMTVPRYKVVTITAGNHSRYQHPIYCDAHIPYYPYRYRYICGYENRPLSVSRECQLIETVDVPVSLQRQF
ncbi:hypothetical protein [Peredibacter starrii]|uniref:Uncharacterized protein n=1 Tax=Peredibacter starrii TaxID=28202 RepID=A0AAX4HIZ5_9BACT|nr:hypothetical protein [Peredibacter starrii]WPU63213.1 hypothetical protein SOO65_11010 [Peredibacter starrii]